MIATTLNSAPASVKISTDRIDTNKAVFLALAVIVSAILIGAAPSAALVSVVKMDQMRVAASSLGILASIAAIPYLFKAAKREDLKSMLSLVAFVGATVGFLIPLSL